MPQTENWIQDITKEYGSLEKYILYMDENGADPLLFGVTPFNYLLQRKLLVEHDIIRTNLEGGFIDGHYSVTVDGKLNGEEAAEGLYSGRAGIHPPEEVLSLKRANNGWTIGIFTKTRIRLATEKS